MNVTGLSLEQCMIILKITLKIVEKSVTSSLENTYSITTPK